ncbi:receptor-like serine/threonine-protein kinase SD1-7 [Magnolia sinica]|uniref:receptor-like serine/threonine-protein kinase SD1-7 n=1 Tax=Magnolia sinica TaxID=86752 RepID=UPI002659A231|nr:receptor-like serine/threonine-protein kinase SD1-7 [Magnolia sinica]
MVIRSKPAVRMRCIFMERVWRKSYGRPQNIEFVQDTSHGCPVIALVFHCSLVMASTRKIARWFVLLLLFIFPALFSHAAETAIKLGQSIRDGETLVSTGGVFELGFFSPISSKNRYVGIWYKQIPEQTIVWVANRDNPITNNSGILTINDTGNLVILDERRRPIMLTSVSYPATNLSRATLFDDGNFVLRNDLGEVLWQSFDHPTDTLLPGMKIQFVRETGQNLSLTSWRSSIDPASGSYSLRVDPNGTLRFLIGFDGGGIHWSSGEWNGMVFSLVPEMTKVDVYNYSLVANENEKKLTYSVYDSSIFSRLVMDFSGQLKQLTWSADQKSWKLLWAQPKDECEMYNSCGANAICDVSTPFRCNCLNGFVADSNTSSRRCLRQEKLMCGDEDGFLRMVRVKFPDCSQYERNSARAGVEYCELRCKSNCSCMAYAAAYSNGTGGCLFWSGDLMGLRDSPPYYNGDRFATGGLYVRVAASVLGERNNSGRKRQIGVIIPVTASLTLIFGIVFLCYLLRWRKLKRKGKMDQRVEILSFNQGTNASAANKLMGQGRTKGPDLPLFSFATIQAATDNFSPVNKLGQGGFGPVYKGKLPEGQEIAVKRLSISSRQGLEEFKNEVIVISKLQHRKLVRLLGWCVCGEEKILIYEYMPNKSLDSFLFDETKKSELDWEKRVRIIEGIAQGLLYLHQYSRLKIIHRDLKASNILLDSNMNPKISDFGMARVFGGDESHANTNRVVGTYGYMSPEYAMRGVFSVKSDVFSFGVLLLEIIGGKKNSASHHFDGFLNLPGHVWELWKEGRSMEFIDPMLVDSSPTSELVRYVHMALLCVQDSATDRPTMSDIVHLLSNKTATMAVPKQPAFCTRAVTEADVRPRTTSVNDVTVSEIEGR